VTIKHGLEDQLILLGTQQGTGLSARGEIM